MSVIPRVPLALHALGRVATLIGGALAIVALRIARTRAVYGDESDVSRHVVCPTCGARATTGADACDDCGHPLAESR